MASSLRIDRRRFLAAAGVGFVAPRRVLEIAADARGGVRPSDQIGLGIIGMGIRGRNLMHRAFLPDDGFRVLAVCDVDTSRRADAKARVDKHYGSDDCAAYLDYRGLLGRDDIDAVVIATPDHWHANQIMHACGAGKHIYCEKPLTLTLHEAKIVMDAVRETGCVFQTGSQQRTEFGHRFVTAAERVRSGILGHVHSVNVGVGKPPVPCTLGEEAAEPGLDWDRWIGPAPMRPYSSVLSPRGVHKRYPKWREYREYAGGGLADMGAHHFDIAQWALGQDGSGPISVAPPGSADAEAGAWLEYEGGTKVIHGGMSGCTFVGKEGVLHVDRGLLESIPGSILEADLPDGANALPRKKSHAADWLECIRNRGRPMCDAEVGARSVAVCHLLKLAYEHRRALTWDPQAWRFADDDANQWLDYERREGYELPAL